MLDALAEALHASQLARLLRASIWLYPLVNTGHLIGIALLFGGIVPLDLRLLGCWRRVPLDHLARVLLPVAIAGLAIAVSTGALLFATRPLDYVAEPLFGVKLTLIGAALVNALALRLSPDWGLKEMRASVAPRRGWRVAGVLSIVLWIAVIAAGRLIGYR